MSEIAKSETVGELAKALAKFHSQPVTIHKNAVNPHFKNRFADLGGILESVTSPLAKVGLSVIQLVAASELTTMLLHESGEWISTTAQLIVGKNDMQGLGSAISYQRRYSLQGILSLAAQDDDGEAASRPAPFKKVVHQAPSVPQVDPMALEYPDDAAPDVFELMDKDKVSESQVLAFCNANKANKGNVEYVADLPTAVLNRLVKAWDKVLAFNVAASMKEAA